MKTYQLFGEYCNAMMWGENPADAVRHLGELPTDGHYDRAEGKYIPGPTLRVALVLGEQDVSNSTRLNAPFRRIIIETEDGERRGLDFVEKGELRNQINQ